jgi:hypothetical protein
VTWFLLNSDRGDDELVNERVDAVLGRVFADRYSVTGDAVEGWVERMLAPYDHKQIALPLVGLWMFLYNVAFTMAVGARAVLDEAERAGELDGLDYPTFRE